MKKQAGFGQSDHLWIPRGDQTPQYTVLVGGNKTLILKSKDDYVRDTVEVLGQFAQAGVSAQEAADEFSKLSTVFKEWK